MAICSVRGGFVPYHNPHFRTVRDMHVRTDHINRHASVSGSYEDSTGAISNAAAQFSVLLLNSCLLGRGLCAGRGVGFVEVFHLSIFRFQTFTHIPDQVLPMRLWS